MYSSWYSEFDWDGAPASDWRIVAVVVPLYLAAIPATIRWMEPRQPFKLRRATALHNLLLSVASLIMCVGCTLELWRRYQATGTFVWFFCESIDTRPRGPLFFWTYVYYLSKFWELFDTALILLQKSKVPHFGFQVFHHALVVPQIWLWCQQQQTLHWGGLIFNTLVHFIMYHYYAWRVLGLPTPWKKWVTKLQILQFVTSFVLLMVTVCIIADRYPSGGTCAGMPSLAYNILLNLTMLVQFIGIAKKNS